MTELTTAEALAKLIEAKKLLNEVLNAGEDAVGVQWDDIYRSRNSLRDALIGLGVK